MSWNRANSLPIRWTMATTQTETIRGPTYSLARAMGESIQGLYLLACGDTEQTMDEDRWWNLILIPTDLRPVHVLQNTWCAS